MPFATCDGIETRYETYGDGPPLVLFSPGGFNATLDNWWSFGIYERLKLVDRLAERFTCIAFDRRESGQSGGRVELLTWDLYARQALGLLDHLGIERAHVLGGCIGCSCAVALAYAAPARVNRAVLYSPAGGPRYKLTQHSRFHDHLAFANEEGLGAVAELARSSGKGFSQDPRVGPWATVLRRDDGFARAYAERDLVEYTSVVGASASGLFDRDTVPGPPAEELLELRLPVLVVPGHDNAHATSAARYLEECLEAEYWDVAPAEQTAANAPDRLLAFLEQ
jgi:pimeloyl-ACP methyl ester carboxylesterase